MTLSNMSCEAKISSAGTSLVVQWSRLPMQGAQLQPLVRELDPAGRNKDLARGQEDPACRNEDTVQPNK